MAIATPTLMKQALVFGQGPAIWAAIAVISLVAITLGSATAGQMPWARAGNDILSLVLTWPIIIVALSALKALYLVKIASVRRGWQGKTSSNEQPESG
jgi:hypothetical protein